MQAIKKDEQSMEITKDVTVSDPIVNTYTLDFLKSQEIAIMKQRDDFVAARQKELDEVAILLIEAEKLGLKTAAEVQAEADATVKVEGEPNLEVIN